MPVLGPVNPVELLRAARAGAKSAARRLQPDHRTITVRSVRFSPQNMVRLYLYVVVAPSRFAPRHFDDRQVARARAFASHAFPGVFEAVPRSAEEAMTLFAVEGDDHLRERALYVHRTGLVELLWALDYEDTGENLAIALEEMASVVIRMAAAIARPPYAELSRAGRGRRRRARVDWWFHVATNISAASGSRSWTELKFSAEMPPRARHDWAAAPADGYGWERLRNSRRNRRPEDVARSFLAEFLTANGYYEFSEALENTIAEASGSLEAPAAPDSEA